MQLVYKGKNRISYSAFANRESSLELAAGSDPREKHWLVPLLKRNLVFCYTRLRNEAVVPASTSLTFSKTQYDLVEAALETKNPHHLLWGFEKATSRKAPPSHSSPAIATHFCRGSYPQLPADVVQFVGIGLSFDRLRIHPKVDEYPCSLLPRWSNIFAETQSSLGSAGRRIVTVWTSFGGNRAGHLGEENVLRPPGPSRKPLLRPTQLPTSDHAQKYTLIHSSTLSCICFPPYSVVVPPARIVGQTMNSTFITGL